MAVDNQKTLTEIKESLEQTIEESNQKTDEEQENTQQQTWDHGQSQRWMKDHRPAYSIMRSYKRLWSALELELHPPSLKFEVNFGQNGYLNVETEKSLGQQLLLLQAELNQLKEENKKIIDNCTAERTMGKKYYNIVEDMKGKIRVFCRIRPLT
ncbi:uncharacterized protein LOC127440205 [Myxocyprinus asiaticus]|uniref:uncharacterized protein LOC127440205 n=1 Tax=Myxocyprinus asiaticus TaxID=70543 RepID=UPI002221B261|nr:uncharacterized protein LOC127440205 [Myxocyprinus asiaticus]